MICLSLQEITCFYFVLFFGLFQTFECQKRSKDTPSFMFCAQRSDKIQTVWWNLTQVHQTCRPGLIKEDLLGEKFAREQISSNNVNTIFFFFSKFFEIIVHLKCIEHFIKHASLMIFDEVFDAFAPALSTNWSQKCYEHWYKLTYH